jgi:hypothetical protein
MFAYIHFGKYFFVSWAVCQSFYNSVVLLVVPFLCTSMTHSNGLRNDDGGILLREVTIQGLIVIEPSYVSYVVAKVLGFLPWVPHVAGLGYKLSWIQTVMDTNCHGYKLRASNGTRTLHNLQFVFWTEFTDFQNHWR